MSSSTQEDELVLSSLPKTWFIDIDGTVLVHNGHLNGGDVLLPSSKEFINSLPKEDKVILVTSRTEEYSDMTVRFLKENGVRFDRILFDMPMGERIVINDRKPSGLKTAFAINTARNKGIKINKIIDTKL